MTPPAHHPMGNLQNSLFKHYGSAALNEWLKRREYTQHNRVDYGCALERHTSPLSIQGVITPLASKYRVIGVNSRQLKFIYLILYGE